MLDNLPYVSATVSETRDQPRLKVPAMYSLLRVRLAGEERYRWTGHIYDVSLTGMRFELDAPLPAGAAVEIRAMLPGLTHTLFRATGQVVRFHDEDESSDGPARMGMCFDAFHSDVDRRRLAGYLSASSLRAA